MTGYNYEVQGKYTDGWEMLSTFESKEEAKRCLEEYEANEPEGEFKIKRIKAY